MEVEKLYPDEWALICSDAHLSVFDESRDPKLDRITYALIAKKDNEPCAYVTVRETDSETVYWQFGGSFPGTRGTTRTMQAYLSFIQWTKERYKRITTFVENTNISYLRLAMSCGFLISGIKNFKNTILVELTLDFEGGL